MSRITGGGRWRGACGALALVGLPACWDSEPDWEVYAISQYVDLTVGDVGRDGHGWVTVEGRRANGSLVLDDAFALTDQMLEWVRRAVQAVADSAGVTAMGDGSETHIRAWRAPQGVIATVSVSNPSGRTETVQVFDDELGRLITVPAYRDYTEAAFWIHREGLIVLRAQAHTGQDIERYAGPSWIPRDIVDVDGDGAPEIVLLEVGYESRHLLFFSIVDRRAVLRWEGLGRGL
ncbi:MAG: hypothetical protein O7I93_17345 [Gemmatimonadetes bacterium]|nr:hypothetical protein [Gemmatimonadota bacterium]